MRASDRNISSLRYRQFFFLSAITVLLLSCSQNPVNVKPNVIILLADDAGYADFGFMGSKDLKTPNIDKIAEQGAHFTDFHVTGSVCAPSRAGLMTGRYQHRFGAEYNYSSPGEGVPLTEQMLSEILQENGYRTAAYGKWHLGEIPEYHPNKRGFDEFYGFIGGHRAYFADKKYDDTTRNTAMQHNGKFVTFDGYLTDVLGHKAIEFIQKNRNNPFFIYLAYNAVHTPMQATEEDLALFPEHPRQKLAAMTWAMDRSIGEVMNCLKQENILDNTLLIFLSDNGGPTGANTASNKPLKGVKGTEFEGGHRVACAMMWKGKIQPGIKYEKLTSAFDLFPSIVDAAKITEAPQNKLDGVSLWNYLNGTVPSAPHSKLFWRIAPWSAARIDSMKLIRADTFGTGLYNLNTDISEYHNLSEQFPEKVSLLNKELENWESEMPEPFGKSSSAWKEVKGYMYKDYLDNREIRFFSPGQLRNYKAKQKNTANL